MPVQTFAPMTKDFATFDCDAHVTEPPKIWERAHEYLTKDELEALKATIWWDAETQQLIVNGKAGAGIGSPRRGGFPVPCGSSPTPGLASSMTFSAPSTCATSIPRRRSPRSKWRTWTTLAPMSPSPACVTWTSRVLTR